MPVFKSMVGERRQMNNGLYATVIKYRNSKDIDVQFDDGVIAFHKSYDAFKKGYILHPRRYKKSNITNTNMI